MESQDSVDNGKSGTITVVSRSLVELCENVCPKTTIDNTTPVEDGGMKSDNPNVPKCMYGTAEPVVTMLSSGNGCSAEQLGTTADDAVKGGIKSDSKSDTDALKSMVTLVSGEKGCSTKPSTKVDVDEFTVISQTLDDLCEKVCSNTTFCITSVHDDGGIKCHNTNVPKGTYGTVEPMVIPLPGGNGCSPELLGTGNDGAANGGIECDDSSDIGALKPMVTLTANENGCSAVPLVTSTIKDGAVKSGMECDTIGDTDTAMNDNKSKICSVGESGYYHHENNNHNEAIDESCCDGNKTTREDQLTSLHSIKCYEGDTDSDDDDIHVNKISSPKDNIEESRGKSSISEECAAGTPVSSNNIVSESNKLKHRLEHVSSTQSCPTNTHANIAGFPKTTVNAHNKVSQVQNADGLNNNKNQNVQDTQMSRQRKKKKVISKKNRSNHQTPSSSSAGLTPCSNAVVNDFEFVLSVVQQDLEVIQMENETAKVTLPSEEVVNEDSSDDDSSSSDTSSSTSTSDLTSSTEFNSKRTCERFADVIEEDEDRVCVTNGPRTKDEMPLSELPPPLDVEVMANKDQIKELGEIESIINAEAMVIIKSFPDVPALDSDSILFLEDGCGFGQVFEIFGQVKSPHYCVRFNNADEIKGKNLSIGQTVFYAPNTEAMTNFVFVSNLQRMKGSDASWKHDQEPPNELLEFSDDEAESAAKSAKKKANRLKKRNQMQTQEKDTQENVKKQRTPNPAIDCTPSTSQPPCKKQVIHQQYQPLPPPRHLNIRQINHPTEFYGERFQLDQGVPMQLSPRSHPPRLGPQPMQRLPFGNFYHHQRPQQYYTQVPAPLQFRSHQPHIPLDMHGMLGPGNYPPQVPLELRLPPPQNAGQPVDQLWSPRVNSHPSGRPIDSRQLNVARPRWPTVHPPIPQAQDRRPPFYCPPR